MNNKQEKKETTADVVTNSPASMSAIEKSKHLKLEESLNIIPLGGVEEVGMNCTVFRYRDQIVVVDAGLGFSDINHLGIDYLIPNYDYLQKHKSKIEAIFITHGHLDHIGSIHHLLEALDYPEVFASKFAMELIKNRLDEAGSLAKAKLTIISPDTKLKSGDLEIEFFRVTHSIPESMGIILRSPVGNVVHSGDFKFDNSPLNEPKSDYYKLAKVGEEGVRLLLSDSTNSFKSGHSISEKEIMSRLEAVVSGSKGRVIVATFASLVTRLYALVEIAKKLNKKIFITGRSMQQSIDVSRKLKYIDAPSEIFIDARSLKRYAESRVMVLATGSQGENMAALSRMAKGEHRDIKLKRGDTVILSSSIIPGNDQEVQKLIDEISGLGAKVFHQSIMNLHTSGHGFIEDQKLMLGLTKPQIFMPIHGYQYFLNRHGQTAVETGVDPKNVIVAKRGDIVLVSKLNWEIRGNVKSMPLLVSGLGVGDVGPLVLQEREQLARSGVVAVSLTIEAEKLAERKGDGYILVAEPEVISKGFVFARTSRELLERLRAEAKNAFDKNKYWQTNIQLKLRSEIEKNLRDVIFELTEREPLIIVQVRVLGEESSPEI